MRSRDALLTNLTEALFSGLPYVTTHESTLKLQTCVTGRSEDALTSWVNKEKDFVPILGALASLIDLMKVHD